MNQRVRVIRDNVLPHNFGRIGTIVGAYDSYGHTVYRVNFGGDPYGQPYPYNEDELEFLADQPMKPMDFASLPDGTIIESSDFGDRYYKVSKDKWVVLTDEILSDPETYNTGGMEACGEIFTVIG